MDLPQALEQSKIVATQLHLGPENYQSAATFHTDALTQTFVELEGGGKNAFVAMMDKKLYMPYTWQVRHFKEFEKNETLIRFTPDGSAYGFKEIISEDIPGAQLSEEQAQTMAEKVATHDFNITLSDYKRVEASQKKQPSERLDHTFVYERIHEKIGEGLYRLQLCVSGDKVTEVTHFIKIPEAFQRRYTQMRSANNSIAWAAMLLMGFLYILCGCGIGLYIIFKSRWEIWKQPLMWGIILACSQALTYLNQLPALWMHYYNAYSINAFLIQLLLGVFVSFMIKACAFTLIIMVAEGLTRQAFGNHPQLWSLMILRNAASYTVLIRSWISYLLVGCLSAFVIAFYALSTRYFNWWMPSDILFNPNILATYVPWFAPIAQSLNAGFLEECLFRAIPLASAALLGNYYKKRNLFIGIAMIVQALIFGAAHANYPTQPAYGRLIELLIPSFIFGTVYVRFGLLPGIITHVLYDLIWFSVPIFASASPHAFYSKIIIIIAGLSPLLITLYARLKQGGWHHLDEMFHNKEWLPTKNSVAQETPKMLIIETSLSQKTHIYGIALSCIAFIIWFFATPFKHDGITISDTRNTIEQKADTYLKEHAIELTPAWQKMPLVFTHYTQLPALALQHRFIWQEGKKDIYHALLNTYLQPAHWTVRYVQFEGDLIQRAEEYKLMFYDFIRLSHHLPESQEGASLTKEDARAIAHKTLLSQFNINPDQVTEISAQETQLPHRRNWLFIFSVAQSYPLKTGQARISIAISGDQVTDAARTIHVPEEWERNEQNNQHKVSIINLILWLLLLSAFIIALIYAHKQQQMSYSLSMKKWVIFFGIIIIVLAIDLINTWPSIVGTFNTSEPWNNQLLQRYGGLLFGMLLKALGLSWLCAYTLQHVQHKNIFNSATIATGYGIGIMITACFAFINKIIPHIIPLWPDYAALGTTIPLISSLTQSILMYIGATAYYMFGFTVINYATHYGQKNKWLLGIFFVFALASSPLTSLVATPIWIVTSVLLGLFFIVLYTTMIRYSSSLIPLATASMIILHNIQQGIFNAYPQAWLAAIINICVIICVSLLWFKKLNSYNNTKISS